MATVDVRAYLSPSLVLLATDWTDGATRDDFLGFAIRRTPGLADLSTGAPAAADWLPNRLPFHGPPAAGPPDSPSNQAPIQKFQRSDARLEGVAAGASLTYEVTPVCGTKTAHALESAAASTITIALPAHVELGIGTWFNRAVMSSQAFSRKCKAMGLQSGAVPTAT